MGSIEGAGDIGMEDERLEVDLKCVYVRSCKVSLRFVGGSQGLFGRGEGVGTSLGIPHILGDRRSI